jgi:cytochrome c-type biogenesis protein CcmH
MPIVRRQIARAADDLGIDAATVGPSPEIEALAAKLPPPAPSQTDREAFARMSPDERSEMIRSMVERLADRLEENPDDLEGWLRLARAYEVMGETDKANDARARADALLDR